MRNGNAKLAAVLFVLVGEEVASQVLKHLNESEIERVSKEISTLGPLPADEAEKSAEEVYRLLLANRFVSEGGADYAQKIVVRSLEAAAAKRITERLSASYVNSNAFEAIERLNPAQLSQFVQNEHPQTIALILAHLSNNGSAELLSSLPQEIQADVVVRMANLESISPDVIRGISAVLAEKLKPVGTYARNQAYGGIRAVAELFNRLDRRQSRAVLEKIESDRPEIANSIRQLMFIFEDIATLDDSAIRELIKRVDKKTLAHSLKGTNEQLQNKFFRNMSQRAVETMQEELEVAGPVKMRDVHSAQQKIVDIVKKLEEEGLLTIGAGEEYVV